MLEQQTWVTLLGFAFGLAMMTYLATMKRDLKAEVTHLGTRLDSKIDGVRTDLTKQIGSVRTDLTKQIADNHVDLKTDIGRLDARLVALESRLHDITLRLPATLTPTQPTAS